MEISGFFRHSDFTWNQFWSLWSPKNAILTIRAALNFSFLGIFQCEIFPKIKIQTQQKLLKWQFFNFWNQLQFISGIIIIVVGQLLNFHTLEYPHSKIRIRLPRSVPKWKIISISFWHFYQMYNWKWNSVLPSVRYRALLLSNSMEDGPQRPLSRPQ